MAAKKQDQTQEADEQPQQQEQVASGTKIMKINGRMVEMQVDQNGEPMWNTDGSPLLPSEQGTPAYLDRTSHFQDADTPMAPTPFEANPDMPEGHVQADVVDVDMGEEGQTVLEPIAPDAIPGEKES